METQQTINNIKNQNTNEKKIRKSGIELLRIVSIFCICLSHATQTASSFVNFSIISFETTTLNLMSYLGQIGNILFIICSAYFLIDSKCVKIEKVLKILLDSMFISITIFGILLICGYQFSLQQCIHQIFPDFFSNMWFIPIYVLFYLVHPLLNNSINQMNQKQHFTFCVFVFFVYGLIGLLYGWALGINDLLCFVIVYFIVAYMKKYCNNFCENKRKNLIFFIVFFGLFVILAIVKSIFSLSHLTLNQFYSPILLPALLCLFNLFNLINISSKTINYFASCSIFVYCIHENILLMSLIRPRYYTYVLGISSNTYLLWVLVCGIGMFIGGYILSIIYKHTLSKITAKISKNGKFCFNKINDFIYKKITKQQ